MGFSTSRSDVLLKSLYSYSQHYHQLASQEYHYDFYKTGQATVLQYKRLNAINVICLFAACLKSGVIVISDKDNFHKRCTVKYKTSWTRCTLLPVLVLLDEWAYLTSRQSSSRATLESG